MSAAESAYQNKVTNRLIGSLREERDITQNLTLLLRAGLGAPPQITLRAYADLYPHWPLPVRTLKGEAEPTNPELHPLLYEWYFNRLTAAQLSQWAAQSGKSVLCLGTPTIARQLVGRSTRVGLVDLDPATSRRMPELGQVDLLLHGDVGSLAGEDTWDVIVMDPPWYLTEVKRWLAAASHYVRRGGTIISTLFPEMTRIEATAERQEILAECEHCARKSNEVQLYPKDIVYSTPLYEVEALRAAEGIEDPGDWRVADLVIVPDVVHRLDSHTSTQQLKSTDGWESFYIGQQTVMLSRNVTLNGSALESIPGLPDDVLPSVSARDKRRASVDLWTSRNRVAAVGNRTLVHKWLNHLAGGASPKTLLQHESDSHLASLRLLLGILQMGPD